MSAMIALQSAANSPTRFHATGVATLEPRGGGICLLRGLSPENLFIFRSISTDRLIIKQLISVQITIRNLALQ
jgi:hypothetical protein